MHIPRGSPRKNQINEGKPLDTPDLRHGQKVKYNFNILVVCAAPFMISTSWLDPISCLNFGEIKCLCYTRALRWKRDEEKQIWKLNAESSDRLVVWWLNDPFLDFLAAGGKSLGQKELSSKPNHLYQCPGSTIYHFDLRTVLTIPACSWSILHYE